MGLPPKYESVSLTDPECPINAYCSLSSAPQVSVQTAADSAAVGRIIKAQDYEDDSTVIFVSRQTAYLFVALLLANIAFVVAWFACLCKRGKSKKYAFINNDETVEMFDEESASAAN